MSTSNNANIARIVIENWSQKTLIVNDFSKTLLAHFQDHQLDWMHACGGKGRCTTCKVIVRKGIDHFGQSTQAEIRYRKMGALGSNERLSCQATITGDVTVAVPEMYKLPHINYSGSPGDEL